MTIFAYEIPKTNWLNPHWAKAEIRRLQSEEISLIEHLHPDLQDKDKAAKIGLTVGQYRHRKQKYGLTKKQGG